MSSVEASQQRNWNSLAVTELFSVAIQTSYDDDDHWNAISALHKKGGKDVLHQALDLTRNADPKLRTIGIDILGQLGLPERTYPKECLKTAIELATNDTAPEVLHAAAIALNHLKDPRGTPPLVRLADHPLADVRYAAALALGGRCEPEAIATLIRLTRDSSDLVRDWAVFGIGQIGPVDTPEVREALFRRLDDSDRQTRYEAISGLARCGDIRGIPPLIAALTAEPQNYELWIPADSFLKRVGAEPEADKADEGPDAETLVTALRRLLAQHDEQRAE
ncbi:MAG TPA: HEAT repeat domain-containing protein [Alphaproteobacteria bacterium]|nr:HEAT repeat domain-containing protein [Alphaproteobacteria bacterium]